MTVTEAFENEVCSRCGGEGRYSYCSMYGDTCFQCQGAKRIFTARGLAAYEYYKSLLSRPTRELEAGMRIRYNGAWMTVEGVESEGMKITVRGNPTTKPTDNAIELRCGKGGINGAGRTGNAFHFSACRMPGETTALDGIRAGDFISYDGHTLEVIETEEREVYLIRTNSYSFSHQTGDEIWRIAATGEEKKAAMEKALAYQETLTKAGTPRKRGLPLEMAK